MPGFKPSMRRYREAPLSLAKVAKLLWAAQDITNAKGQRTALLHLRAVVSRFGADGSAMQLLRGGEARTSSENRACSCCTLRREISAIFEDCDNNVENRWQLEAHLRPIASVATTEE